MRRSIENINNLKKQVIERYPELKDESDFLVNEAIITDLDTLKLEYDNPILDELDASRKSEVSELAHEYRHLCFYDGDVENWLDSVENAHGLEEMAVMRILDNYDFLCELARDGGKATLEFADRIKDKSLFCDYAFIDAIRNNFVHDIVLKNILIGMSEENSSYNVFTDEQKSDLLTYPEGTLYFYGEEGVKMESPLLLSMEIYNRMNTKNNIEFSDFDDDDYETMTIEMYNLLKRSDNFTDTVMKMSRDYRSYINKVTGKKDEPVNELMGIQTNVDDYKWNISNEQFKEMFEEPYNPERITSKSK